MLGAVTTGYWKPFGKAVGAFRNLLGALEPLGSTLAVSRELLERLVRLYGTLKSVSGAS